MTRTKSVRVFAPASVANFGVGFDALGAALDGPGDTVTARLAPRRGVFIESISGDGGALPLDPDRNTASVAAAVVLELARKGGSGAKGLSLVVEKGLPLASGLGSSAASAAAGAFAAALLLGIADKAKLLAAVLIGENAADGSWHGDNAFASLFGGIVLVPSSDPKKPRRPIPLAFPDRLRLVLVHPDLSLPTAEARRVLPREVSLGKHVSGAAAFALLVAALSRGDLKEAGRCVSSDAIVEPAREPLVPALRIVKAAMRKAGALGCALAGAGPSVMGIAEDGPAARKIAAAGVAAFRAAGIAAEGRVHSIDRLGARDVTGVTV